MEQPGFTPRIALAYETLLEYKPTPKRSLVEPVPGNLSSVAIENMYPVRESPQWQGKTYYEGTHWMSSTRTSIRFESLLERDFLIAADFGTALTGIQWQPFILTWPRGTVGHRDHVPDYFCRLASGDGLVVDVKWAGGLERSARQFEMTREVCEQIGWRYEVFSGIHEPRRANLLFLSGFRQDRYRPSEDLAVLIADVCATSTTLARALNQLRWTSNESAYVIRGCLLHEIWNGVVMTNVDLPLNDDSVLSAPPLPRTQVVAP